MGKSGGSTLKWTGTSGNDTAVVTSVDALAHTTYDAGAGYDTLDLSQLGAGVSLDAILGVHGRTVSSNLWAYSPFVGSWWTFYDDHLSGAPRVQNTILNFEKIIGTAYNDYLELRGGSVARVVDGGAGDDSVYVSGSSGTSTAIGGTGSDQLFGGGHPDDIFVGGTYANGVATPDGASDAFDLASGTILDFEVGVDKLYFDVSSVAGTWTDVTTQYGAGASMATSAGAVTLVGHTAAEMNAIPIGMAVGFPTGTSSVTSGAGDDLIVATTGGNVPDQLIFPDGSGNDEVVGFETNYDTLVFPDDASGNVSWSQIAYHGGTALVASYDGGHSSVTLAGLAMTDLSHLSIQYAFG